MHLGLTTSSSTCAGLVFGLLTGCFASPPTASEDGATSTSGATTSPDATTGEDDSSSTGSGSTGLDTTGTTGTGSTSTGTDTTDGDDSNGTPGDCMPIPDMACIPSGSFTRGTLPDGMAPVDESPQEEVLLSAFNIDRYEVTVAEYAACEADGPCTVRGATVGEDPCATQDDHPANCVTWEQAATYCTWAGKQLPTEAQWERAARGRSGGTFPWGTDEPACNLAVFLGCTSTSPTAPVGSRSPMGDSPDGLADVAGNVFEWTADWYAPNAYEVDPNEDPVGPPTGTERVVRGGFYGSSAVELRAARRQPFGPMNASSGIGFRCAAPAPSAP